MSTVDDETTINRPPLSLTDSQMDIVRHAAEPLPWCDRSGFLEAVAARLHGVELGDGVVHRVCAELQKEFFRAPALARNALPRWSRRVGGGVRRDTKATAEG
jgi:hypothetical protein